MVGDEGFEPPEWRDQNPLPYHLANPQQIYFLRRLQLEMYTWHTPMYYPPKRTYLPHVVRL